MKTKTIVITFTVVLFLILTISMVQAQMYSDARSLGMAQAYTALARGVDAPLWNPANLKLPTAKKFSLQLFALGLRFGNSSFSKHSYDIYNGKYLSSSDIQDILDAIPDDGFRPFLDSEVRPLGFAYGPLALTFSGVAATDVRLFKDLFDLIDGPEWERRYDLENANSAQAWGYGAATLSWAHLVRLPKIQQIILGMNFHYIFGLGYAEIVRSWGSFYYGWSSTGEGGVKVRTAQGGSGFAMDFGMAREYRDWTFSLALTNLISHITWNREPQEFEAYFYSTEPLTVHSIAEAEEDSIIKSDESTKDIASFSTKLPVELRLGATTIWRQILISLDYHQGFRERPGVTTTPYLAVGSEFSYIGFLPLRLGLGLGGDHKILSALGFGLKLGFFHFDYGINFNGALWPTHAKALSMALGTTLRF